MKTLFISVLDNGFTLTIKQEVLGQEQKQRLVFDSVERLMARVNAEIVPQPPVLQQPE